MEKTDDLPNFFKHTSQCEQCRKVLEAFFAEMPQPGQLCSEGAAILQNEFHAKPKE